MEQRYTGPNQAPWRDDQPSLKFRPVNSEGWNAYTYPPEYEVLRDSPELKELQAFTKGGFTLITTEKESGLVVAFRVAREVLEGMETVVIISHFSQLVWRLFKKIYDLVKKNSQKRKLEQSEGGEQAPIEDSGRYHAADGVSLEGRNPGEPPEQLLVKEFDAPTEESEAEEDARAAALIEQKLKDILFIN